MKLRQITLLGAAALTLAMTVAMSFVSRKVLLEHFAAIERQNLNSEVQRTVNLFNAELQEVNRTAQDYSSWDDTYHFMRKRNAAYLRSNFSDVGLQNLKLRSVLLIDTVGRPVFLKSIRAHGEMVETDSDVRRLLDAAAKLTNWKVESCVAGIVILSDGPVLVSIHPILKTDGQGPSRGNLLMARDVDYHLLAHVSSLIQLPITVKEAKKDGQPDVQPSLTAIRYSGVFETAVLDDQRTQASTTLYDLWGKPNLILQVQHDREVPHYAQHAINVLMISIMVLGLLFGIVDFGMVQYHVVRPVEKLIKFTKMIGGTDGLKSRIQIDGKDEISELAAHMNKMIQALEVSHEKLLATREHLKYEATHDALTGAWNRPAALELLDRELDRCRREHSTVAVMMLDADHFKSINDRYGHGAGDKVLQTFTTVIARSLRSFDVLARYGGEEFLIIAPNCSAREARNIMQRILLKIETTPIIAGENVIHVTMSAGITAGASPHTAEDLVAVADRAMYRAKENGRNRTEYEEMSEEPARGLFAMPRRVV